MRVIRRDYPGIGGIFLLVVNLILGIIEFLIGLRIILELFGANTSATFVQWVYSASLPFITPFFGIFPNRWINGQFYLDLAAILAFFVYAFIAYLINALFDRYIDRDSVVRRDDYLE